MSEMIYRIAKAMWKADCWNTDFDIIDNKHPLFNKKLFFLESAKVAIEAMRDVPDVCYDNYCCDVMYKDDNTKDIFLKWIDAALK